MALSLSIPDLEEFRKRRCRFVHTLRQLIVELGLEGRIDHITVGSPTRDRAELYRNGGNPWPSKRVCLEVYTDRYLDEQLLRHELGHEADRWNPEMFYDPEIEKRWKNKIWALEMAANISLDSRLGERGLGKDHRHMEFRKSLMARHDDIFDELWANPPRTWPEIEELAHRLVNFRR